MNKKFPYQLIELTHTLSSESPAWESGCGFQHEIKLDYTDCDSQVKFRVQHVNMHAGIGTHLDSPSHCISGAATVEQIPLNKLIVPLIVIDVHEKMSATYKISVEDILNFETTFGKIQANSFVAFYTGWSRYWNDPKKYLNNYLFPSVSESVANLLLKRDIVGIGIDTLSPDIQDSEFPVHQIILGASRYIVENIANLEKIPQIGSYVIILPIKGAGLTESPVRMVGLISENKS